MHLKINKLKFIQNEDTRWNEIEIKSDYEEITIETNTETTELDQLSLKKLIDMEHLTQGTYKFRSLRISSEQNIYKKLAKIERGKRLLIISNPHTSNIFVKITEGKNIKFFQYENMDGTLHEIVNELEIYPSLHFYT